MKKIVLLYFLLLFNFSTVFSQSNTDFNQYFTVFNFKKENIDKLKNLEPILVNNENFEMVRVDYSRCSVFIVSTPGFRIDNLSLSIICGDFFKYVQCEQFGVQWQDSPNFDILYNCNNNNN